MTDDGSTLAGRRLGAYLREARLALNLNQAETARMADLSPAGLQRLERGTHTRLKARDVEALCRVLEMSPSETQAMIGLHQKTREKSWWHAYGDVIPTNFDVYVGLESAAHRLTVYQPSIVPGLLQTKDYAHALLRAGYPDLPEDELARRLEFREQRQVQLTRSHRPLEVLVVLHEAVLLSRVGDDEVMANQLHHLAEMGKRENVTLHVLPFWAGVPLGHPIGHYALLEFGDPAHNPPVVHVESFTGSMYLEKPGEVSQYVEVTRKLRRHTLDEDASRTRVREIIKEQEK